MIEGGLITLGIGLPTSSSVELENLDAMDNFTQNVNDFAYDLELVQSLGLTLLAG